MARRILRKDIAGESKHNKNADSGQRNVSVFKLQLTFDFKIFANCPLLTFDFKIFANCPPLTVPRIINLNPDCRYLILNSLTLREHLLIYLTVGTRENIQEV